MKFISKENIVIACGVIIGLYIVKKITSLAGGTSTNA